MIMHDLLPPRSYPTGQPMSLHWRMLQWLTAGPTVYAAQAAALAGAPLALAASASAARRRRQLLSTTLAPQQARHRLCMCSACCSACAHKSAWLCGTRA